jgi:hypothetical protein
MLVFPRWDMLLSKDAAARLLISCSHKCEWRHPGHWESNAKPRFRGASVSLAAVVPAAVVLMPPAAARTFASPTPQTGVALTRTCRPARNAPFATQIMPSALVASTLVGRYWRRQVFRRELVCRRSDRRCQGRPGRKNAHREEGESCIESLHENSVLFWLAHDQLVCGSLQISAPGRVDVCA